MNRVFRIVSRMFWLPAALLFPKQRPRPAPLLAILSAAALCLGGCAAGGLHPAAKGGPVELAIGDVVDTATGEVMSLDGLIEKLMPASVIYIGEMHTSVEDHLAQLAILRKLQEKSPCIMVGMEMFPRSAQPVLDSYTRGETTEDRFLAESRWDQVWGFPYLLYRGLVDFAREKRLRILGLNAPGEVVKEIARNGLDSLPAEDRARIAHDFHLDDPKNRARIRQDYDVHGKDHIRDFETFFAAQLAWEETMAETIAQQVKVSGGNCKIVVMVGKGHLTDRLGVPYLAALRVPHEYRTVAPVPFDYPNSTFDPDIAQYILITDKPQAPHRPRLGVKIQSASTGKGVEIVEVFPDSPAAKSDIRVDDIILEVDRLPVNTPTEVQQALATGGPEHKILIERQGKKMTINVKTNGK